uniref:Uncharacterized protein n=1 Tax=Pararge aegeria TaxID=116150 RepID=S4NNZ8_9NEOP
MEVHDIHYALPILNWLIHVSFKNVHRQRMSGDIKIKEMINNTGYIVMLKAVGVNLYYDAHLKQSLGINKLQK